jgi:RNA-directed DNA polymerase
MTRDLETTSESVAATPKQSEDIRSRWSWTEPSVWTDRMLTALETGVKGDKWFSLIDKVWRMETLKASWAKVKSNDGSAGVDNVSLSRFEQQLEQELTLLSQRLQAGSYQPHAVRRVYIPKSGGGQRPLGIPAICDRVVQGALRQVIEPIFEKTFSPCSYGFRPGRGCKDALREVDRLLKVKYDYVVEVDIQGYFDNIPHHPLLEQVKERISDSRILTLIEQFLQQPVRDEGQQTHPTSGTPQGGLISPLLANIYLNPLDQLLTRQGYQVIRYADDMVVLCQEDQTAHRVMEIMDDWMRQVGLTLHPEKTRVVDMRQDGAWFDFLGYRFKRNRQSGKIDRWPRPKSVAKLKERLRPYTRRSNGHSLNQIITRIGPVLKGWYEYFKHARPGAFLSVDGWVRMRLRSMLRKRAGRRGRGRGLDNQRWPNVFFAEQGLFSLETAYVQGCQSVYR